MHRLDRLAAVRALSGTQDGQFATKQALACGLSRAGLRALAQRGEIENRCRGVWRFCAVPGAADPAVTAYLACWPHGVVSHESAAAKHGLTRVPVPQQPVITIGMDVRREPPRVTVHRTRDLGARDVVQIGEVRYTSLARTLCDLSNADDPWETLALLDDAVALGANPRWIHQRAAALVNGRRAVALLREATAPGAANVFRSWLERASAHIYRSAALPDPEWNVPLRDSAGLIGVVDALWRAWCVVSEKEGLRFHATPQARREDAQRFNRLADAGYQSRRFTWEDVVHRPVEVAATVLRALRAAGADLDPGRLPRAIVLPHRPFL